jgi:hypothetical protein
LGSESQNFEALTDTATPIQSAMQAIKAGEMILPTAVPGVGPYPHSKQRRVNVPAIPTDTTTLAHLYAALLADVSLDLIGSRDVLIIDGRFAHSPVFTRALASLRTNTMVLINQAEEGVARGALSLLDRKIPAHDQWEKISPIPIDIKAYRARWREAAEQSGRTH